jgi:hypothetical protein
MAIIDAQRDFSSGELNVDAKRRDDQPIMRAGARKLRNWRVLNSGAAINRPGRSAVFSGYPRTDQVLVSTGTIFWLCFSDGTLTIRDITGAVVKTGGGYAWTAATVRQIVWTIVPTSAGRRDIVMTFPGQIMKVATWVSGSPWTFSDYAFYSGSDGSSLVPFYRFSSPGAAITPSATVGNITIAANSDVFVPGMVNSLIRWINKQIRITAYTDARHVSGTVLQQLYGSLVLNATAGFIGGFAVGDIIADTSGTEAEIFAIATSGGNITSISVNLMQARMFTINNAIYAPSGSFVLTSQTTTSPGPSVQWDESVFSSFRGWPQSCFFDQNRLGFCDIPALPNGITWSRIGQFGDFLPDAVTASDPIFEIAPERSRVYHVATKQDEIVLTDRGVWYIPISETNPLKPGSVAFKKISVDAASPAKPSETNEGIIFIGAGLNRVVAVMPTGTLTQPWKSQETSLFHQHLFNSPFAIASTIGDDTFAERYVYVLNSDGSVAVGKYDAAKQWVGWLPWDSKGVPQWVSVLGSTTTFVTMYGTAYVAETIDSTVYLDGAVLLNNIPAALAPPGVNLTSLWWLRNLQIDLMDGVKPLGTYQVDGTGTLVPNSPGEDLSSPTIIAGTSWVSTIEPFVPNADAGADQKQRTRRRRIQRIVASVERSTGFKFSKLYNGPAGAQLSAPGTEIGSHRITPWNQDDNQALAPPLRNQTYTWRPTGRAYDPRVALVKDVPGPITVVEIGMEVTT